MSKWKERKVQINGNGSDIDARHMLILIFMNNYFQSQILTYAESFLSFWRSDSIHFMTKQSTDNLQFVSINYTLPD